MKRAGYWLPVLLILLLSRFCSPGQPAAATNSPGPRSPRMWDISKWASSSMEDMRRGADQGDTGAMTALYFAYCDGQGNCNEGLKWLTKAAEAGNAYAQCLYGFHFESPDVENNHIPPSNMPEALLWYHRSADQGFAGAQYRLGLCYLHGKGVEQDEETGLEWLRKGADQGQLYALNELVACYGKGIGAPRDAKDRPLQLLARITATEIRDNEDYYALAKAYDHLIFRCQFGVGTQRDILAAAAWYCKAAIKGISQYTLADKVEASAPKQRPPPAYESVPGRWEPGDPIYPALSLYLKAARGSSDAMIKIGDLYLTGENVPNDPTRAWVWFTIASQNGAQEAAAKISQAASHLNTIELAKAQKMLPILTAELQRASSASQ